MCGSLGARRRRVHESNTHRSTQRRADRGGFPEFAAEIRVDRFNKLETYIITIHLHFTVLNHSKIGDEQFRQPPTQTAFAEV